MKEGATVRELRTLILYAYELGGNTREIAKRTNIPHDDVTSLLLQADYEQATGKSQA